jgi:hypothetical protein
MNFPRVASFGAALALASFAALGEAPADYALRQALSAPLDKAFFRIELPDAVYDGAARADLGDLRVFNGDGAPVPFAFLPRPVPLTTESPRRALALFPMTVDTTRPGAGDLSIKLRNDAGGTSVELRTRDGTPVSGTRILGYLIDTGTEDAPLVALRLPVQDAGNVNARLRVDASEDLDRWRTIVADAPVLSLEYNGRRLVRDRVEFPPQRARYLRITWLSSAPPALSAASGDIGDRFIDPPRRIRKAAGVHEEGTADLYTFDLGGALPVDRITLELPEVNSVAPVTWEARTSAQDPWRAIGSSVVYRLRRDAGEVTSPEYPIAPNPARYFRARIDPKSGGVGSAPPTIAAGWYPHEIVVAARGKPPFELAYGSRRVPPAALPIATLVPGYVAGKPLPDGIGIATAAATASTANAAALREPLDVKRWVLWGSLVLASLLLGYMALRLSRQLRVADAPAASAKPETIEEPRGGS